MKLHYFLALLVVALPASLSAKELTEINKNYFVSCEYNRTTKMVTCIDRENRLRTFENVYPQCTETSPAGEEKLGKYSEPWSGEKCTIWKKPSFQFRIGGHRR